MEIDVTIEGVTPLILHRFTDAAAMKATSGNGKSTIGDSNGTPQEQADQSLYRDEDGNLIIPQPNLFKCLIEGGRFFKAGKSKITTMKSSLLPACMAIDPINIPLLHNEPWTVDTRPVRIPSTGGRILRHRPLFEDWKLQFTVDLDTDIIGKKLYREIVDAAGKRIGLGEFRPDCKGPYGRFKVTEWKERD